MLSEKLLCPEPVVLRQGALDIDGGYLVPTKLNVSFDPPKVCLALTSVTRRTG